MSKIWDLVLRPKVLFGILVAGTVLFLGFQWQSAESQVSSMRDSLDVKRQQVAALSDSLEQDSTYRVAGMLRRLYSRTDFTSPQDSLQEDVPETATSGGREVQRRTRLSYEADRDTLSGETEPKTRSAEEWTYDYETQTSRFGLDTRLNVNPQSGLLSYRHILDPKAVTIKIYSTKRPSGVTETFADVPMGRVTQLRSVRGTRQNNEAQSADRWQFGAEAVTSLQSAGLAGVVRYESGLFYGRVSSTYSPEMLRPDGAPAVQPAVRVGVLF